MVSFLVGLSIASLLTAMFAFRFDAGRKVGVLVAYFALFFGIEWLADRFLLPPGALGMEVVYVCFALTILFVIGTGIVRRLDEHEAAARRGCADD
jgi:hypothetical protein